MSARPALWVLAAAMILLGCNIGVAYAPLGDWHGLVSVGLCVLEGSALALWWMHLLASGALLRLCAAVPLGAFILLAGLVMLDVATRVLVTPPW